MATVHYGRLVGTGGFAKTVAIKRLRRQFASDHAFRNMILEEGRLAARVRHPNVVPPLDVLAEGGELLLVMEYVHGESLSRLLRAAWTAGERVPLSIGAAILSNVLHGLHAAHEAKDEAGEPLDIVHRDISPQNVIVGADGVARVIDFGIAKAVTSEEMTLAGTIKGKVPYLSPEQLEGRPATRRTDIYAAAVIFWEMLANRRLFQGKDDGEILRKIVSADVMPPSELNGEVDADLDGIVLRALSPDPDDRYASAREMALDIESVVHLATVTAVGEWTERLAIETLAKRAENIREVETAAPPEEAPSSSRAPARSSSSLVAARAALAPPPSPPSPVSRGSRSSSAASPTRPPPPSRALRSSPSSPTLPPPPPSRAPRSSPQDAPLLAPPPPPPPSLREAPKSQRVSAPPVRPPPPVNVVMEARSVIYEPPPMPEPAFVEGVRAFVPGAPLPPPAGAPQPPPAGALRKPELEIRNVDWLSPREDPKPPPGSAFKRFLRYLAAFLVLTLIVFYMFAPAFARAWLVNGAAARGIVVTIDRVDVSRRAIRLSDVHAASPDVPGASVRAGTVSIDLHWLVPEHVSVDDIEISLDGSYATLATRFAQYRAKHPAAAAPLAGLHEIEVTSGRVVWNDVIGKGTSALVENVTFDMKKNPVRAFGDDYRFSAPLLTMKLAGAPAGPWQIDVDRQGILVRSVLHFDPSNTFPASVTRTAGDDGSVSLMFMVPPTALSDLHFSPAVFGPLATGRTRLAAKGEVSIVAMQQTRVLSGKVSLAAQGIALFAGGPPVDLTLDLPISGGSAAPIAITGALAVAPSDATGAQTKAAGSAALEGVLDVSRPATRIELQGTTGPIPCARLGAAGAGRDAATAFAATIDATLDDLPGARVGWQPVTTCSPRPR